MRTLTTAGNFSLPLVPVLGPEVSFGQHLSWRKSATRQQPECHQASRKAFPSHFSWLYFDTTSELAREWENSICICIYFHLVLMSKHAAAAAAVKSLQSCPTLCNPIDGSPPGSPVPGILQAGTLEWVAISFSNAWKWKVKVKSLSHVQLLATPWTAAYQASPAMGFSRLGTVRSKS